MADSLTTATAILAKMVQGLSLEPTTASAMAENNTQPTAWKPGPGQRGQHFNFAMANSSHPRHTPRHRWYRSGSNSENLQGFIQTSNTKIRPLPCISDN